MRTERAQSTKRLGNASKRLVDASPGPWVRWRTKARHARAIRWIESYCVPPKGFGAGQPLKLARFQKEWLEDAFGEGVSSSVMAVPRGNGKSTFLGAVAAWAVFDPDESGAPQIPVVATTLGQAHRATYGVALSMINANRDLYDRCLVYSGIGYMKVAVPFTGGEMFPVSCDPPGLQGLDPSIAVCDEIGFMPIESWDSLLLASGKRPRSLVVGIGTPGFDRESALWHLREQVYAGVEVPGFRFTEYAATEGCPLADEDEWRAANPALESGYMNIDALRTQVRLSPEAHFRIFRLGQWVEGVECWLGEDGRKLWRSLCDSWRMVAGAPTWVGVDVGLKHDSTAVVWCQQRDDGRWHVDHKIWLPRPGGELDVSDTMQCLRELVASYDVREIVYDSRYFHLPAQMLADEGLPMVEFPQSLERMSPAVGATHDAIKRREVSHNGDQAFETQVLNAVARYNERGFVLAKAKSGRIDAAVAMCMALYAALELDSPKAAPSLWAAYA